MTFLVVGLDRRTLTPWQRHVRRHDTVTAASAAVAHAAGDGIDLVVAAVIGAGSNALDLPTKRPRQTVSWQTSRPDAPLSITTPC